MLKFIEFFWLTLKCITFVWALSVILILILFIIGSEAEGYSWAERILIAIKYAAYVGGIFGTLLAFYIWWKNWKITRHNAKTLARNKKTKTS